MEHRPLTAANLRHIADTLDRDDRALGRRGQEVQVDLYRWADALDCRPGLADHIEELTAP